MARTIPVTTIQEWNAESTPRAFFELLEVTHSTFSTVRLVNNIEDVTSNSEVYTAFPFRAELPPQSRDFQPRLRVQVSNVTRLLVAEFRGIAGSTERAKATLSVVDSSDPDSVLVQFPSFTLANLNYDANLLNFDLAVESFLTEAFPSGTFSPATAAGLF